MMAARERCVQALAVPRILEGTDVTLAAETGSGKTLAYLLPLIQSVRERHALLRELRPDAPECANHYRYQSLLKQCTVRCMLMHDLRVLLTASSKPGGRDCHR